MDRNNQFLEPERGGSGIVGWAVKQLVLWLVGGFLVYTFVVNHQLFSSGPPQGEAPRATGSQTGNSVADVTPSEKLRPLGQPVAPATNQMTLRARSDGHVVVNAMVNGASIKFLVDTGATTVALTPQDAIRAGVAGGLNYSIAVSTANGMSRAAPVTLREVTIETLEINDVRAEVMEAQGGISLLGQTFLSRLQSYQMQDGILTLTWQ
jgi:aspartyl protease family protein